jgi:hypothetical protein
MNELGMKIIGGIGSALGGIFGDIKGKEMQEQKGRIFKNQSRRTKLYYRYCVNHSKSRLLTRNKMG